MVAVADTVAHLRRREAERRRAAAERRRLAEAALPVAREILLRHGAESVTVFGSLATGEETPDSDLDLAVAGLPPERYFPALGELASRLAIPIDLVRVEEAPASLRDRIAAEGRRV